MPAPGARRFLISGRVQAVGYRWFVIRAAMGLGLTGWTRNLEDGRVEVLAMGEPADLDALRERLRAGPPASRVSRVDEFDADPDPGVTGFGVKQ